MENICEWSSNLIQDSIMVWFISSFCGCKYEGMRKKLLFAGVVIFDFFVISIIDSFKDYDGLLSIISIIIFIVYAQISLKGSTFLHIFASIFTMETVFAISSFVLIIMGNILTLSSETLISDFSANRIILLCICRAVEFFVFKLLLRMNFGCELSVREWLICIAVLTFTWIEITLFTKASLISADAGIYMSGAAVIAVIINILIYGFITYLNKNAALEREYALVKMQYDNIKNTENNMKILYENTYGIKHDLEKHFLYVKTKIENGETDAAKEYIDNITKKQLCAAHKIMFTDNDVFNALSNIRLEICHKKKIITRMNIDGSILNEIPQGDTAVFFGNLLDNAIEAAEKTSERLITLDVGLQDEYIFVYMENSFCGDFDENLKTTKKGSKRHGVGMKNISNIVKKYDGMMRCFVENGMFCTDILLKRSAILDAK